MKPFKVPGINFSWRHDGQDHPPRDPYRSDWRVHHPPLGFTVVSVCDAQSRCFRGRIELPSMLSRAQSPAVPPSNSCDLINQGLFHRRVNASHTILSLIGADYYYLVTEKTGRGIEITTRRVTYSPGTLYFPRCSWAELVIDGVATARGRVIKPRKM